MKKGCLFIFIILILVGITNSCLQSCTGREVDELWGTSWLVFGGIVLFLVILLLAMLPLFSSPTEETEVDNSEEEDFSEITPEQVSLRDDYFNKCLFVADEIVCKIQSIMDDEEHFEAIKNIRGIDALDTDIYGKYNSRVVFIVLYDIWKCYRALGYREKYKGHSNLCFAVAVSKLTNEVDMAILSDRKLCKSTMNLGKSTMEFYVKVGLQGHDGETDFLMLDVYNFTGQSPVEYLTFLYLVADCIASADTDDLKRKERFFEKLRKLIASNSENGSLALANYNSWNAKERGNVYGQAKAKMEHEKTGLEQLTDLIGLKNVKRDIRKLMSFVEVQQKRQAAGLASLNVSCHCVFLGNPGTGKTTVARIMAKIFKDLGILKKGHLVETDRAGLVAEYVGQTAVKTNKIINKALDGVLFIDEAYSLFSDDKVDFGYEAIATLLKRMEDDRDRLVVILAGYGEEMRQMINSNPGLQSRFNRYLYFEDYSAMELWEIFALNLSRNEYMISDSGAERMKSIFEMAVERKGANFGNARFVRNLFEKILENHAVRMSGEENPDKKALQEILPIDIANLQGISM